MKLLIKYNAWRLNRLYKELRGLENGMLKANIEFEIWLREKGEI